ncbi:MAG: hypothetical protein ACJ8GK_11075, partial [Luteimonas sp.]
PNGERNVMRVGFNYAWAWDRYGMQIGPYTASGDAAWDADRDPIVGKPLPRFKLPTLFDNLARNLQELSAIGISVVRWFLIANGSNYGRGPWRRIVDEGSTKASVWEFTLPRTTDPRYTFHLRELLKAFRAAKMQIIPSFVDFPLAGDSPPPDANGLAFGGRADLIRDKAKRTAFLNGIFLDLLVASREFKDVIYAWEVMNEPSWMLNPPLDDKLPMWSFAADNAKKTGKPLLRWPMVTQQDLSDFLTEAIQLIQLNGFASTVGHRFFDDLTRLPTGSLPQYHYYAKKVTKAGLSFGDPDSIAPFKGEPAPFLGEFASDQASAEQSKPWPDLSGKTETTLERLKLLESKGCQLCLIWPDLAGRNPSAPEPCAALYDGGPVKCDPIKMHPKTVEQIKKYLGK